MRITNDHLLNSYKNYAFGDRDLAETDLSGLLQDHRVGALIWLINDLREQFVIDTSVAKTEADCGYAAGSINGMMSLLGMLETLAPQNKKSV